MLLIWQLSNWITIFFLTVEQWGWEKLLHGVITPTDHVSLCIPHLRESQKRVWRRPMWVLYWPHPTRIQQLQLFQQCWVCFLAIVATLLHLQTQLKCPFHSSWSLSKHFLVPTTGSAVNLTAWTYPFGNPTEIFQASEIFVLSPVRWREKSPCCWVWISFLLWEEGEAVPTFLSFLLLPTYTSEQVEAWRFKSMSIRGTRAPWWKIPCAKGTSRHDIFSLDPHGSPVLPCWYHHRGHSCPGDIKTRRDFLWFKRSLECFFLY